MFRLEINCDNDAFDANHGTEELARILRSVASRLETSIDTFTYQSVYDINGNTIGTFRRTPEDKDKTNLWGWYE